MPIKKVNLGRGEARSLLQNDVSQMEWNFSIFFQSAFCAWLSPLELCVYALSSRAISSSHVRQAIRSLTLIQKKSLTISHFKAKKSNYCLSYKHVTQTTLSMHAYYSMQLGILEDLYPHPTAPYLCKI